MKGVVLAGGTGSRLNPLTRVTNKHLLPIYDKPMVYYPIQTLVNAGIEEILLVTGGKNAGDFLRLLGNGRDFGLKHLNYTYQEGEGGIAEALGLAEYFAAGDPICVILGDNIIESNVSQAVDNFRKQKDGAKILLKEVTDAQRFGVAEIRGNNVVGIEEKPKAPKSNYAVIGIYLYDATVFQKIRRLKPSGRGELEITDVNNFYIEERKLTYEVLDGWWTDAGQFESLLRANNLVAETGANNMTKEKYKFPAESGAMKLLVTGGAGFIGSNFIRHVLALDRGYAIVNFDKLTYAGNLANLESVAADPKYQFVKGDICDAGAVEAAMAGCDAVVHFAAESHVDRSIYEPAASIETNVKGTFILLQVARKLNVARFVHISTDEVYGDMFPRAFADENSPLQPSSPYSSSKAGSDLLVRSYVRTYGFPALITRSSNNYGPYQFPEKFLPLMITNALDNAPLPIYGDGKQQRDWLHVEDNCRGVLAVLERGRIGEVYNLGGVDIEENLSMAKRLLRVMGKPETLLTYVKDRPGHDRRYALKCGKMERELGWEPAISLDDGLGQTIDWYKANAGWMAGIRGGEYRSYYEKYYENRDSSLQTIARSAPRPRH